MALGPPGPYSQHQPDRGQEREQHPGELPLDLRDARLPWLEAEENDELRRGGGGRVAAVGCGLVLLLALAGGGGWYLHRQREAAAMVATGGIIRAPAGPYKVRPPNPGGDVAAGTGDTRFLVAEGKTRAVHVGGAADVPMVDASGAAAPAGTGVQLGAYASGAEAEAAWPGLAGRFPVLSGLRHRVVEQQADLGSVFALQAVTADPTGAQMLCRDLKAGGLRCMVRD